MYEVPVRGKEMVLLDGANGFAEIYYMPVYPRYHCLSEETVFNNDYSVIQELILDKEKIKYVPPVFEVAEVEKGGIGGAECQKEIILRMAHW